jgi:hypothetical protein
MAVVDDRRKTMNHHESRSCPYDPTCGRWTGQACGGNEDECPARDAFGGMVCVAVAVGAGLIGAAVLWLAVWR